MTHIHFLFIIIIFLQLLISFFVIMFIIEVFLPLSEIYLEYLNEKFLAMCTLH